MHAQDRQYFSSCSSVRECSDHNKLHAPTTSFVLSLRAATPLLELFFLLYHLVLSNFLYFSPPFLVLFIALRRIDAIQ